MKTLRERIRLISNDEKEYGQLIEQMTQHFEGKCVFNDMPDKLKTTFFEWEQEMYEGRMTT